MFLRCRAATCNLSLTDSFQKPQGHRCLKQREYWLSHSRLSPVCVCLFVHSVCIQLSPGATVNTFCMCAVWPWNTFAIHQTKADFLFSWVDTRRTWLYLQRNLYELWWACFDRQLQAAQQRAPMKSLLNCVNKRRAAKEDNAGLQMKPPQLPCLALRSSTSPFPENGFWKLTRLRIVLRSSGPNMLCLFSLFFLLDDEPKKNLIHTVVIWSITPPCKYTFAWSRLLKSAKEVFAFYWLHPHEVMREW